MSDFREVKDSGQRRASMTGSVRDRAEGKGRYDLVSPIGLERLAVHYENGARKYGDRNWEKGQPVSWYIDSGVRHFFKYLAGKRDEDHLAAVAWNAFGAIHTIEKVKAGELPAELDDVVGDFGEAPDGVVAALAALGSAIEAAEEVEAVDPLPPGPVPFPTAHPLPCRYPVYPCDCTDRKLRAKGERPNAAIREEPCQGCECAKQYVSLVCATHGPPAPAKPSVRPTPAGDWTRSPIRSDRQSVDTFTERPPPDPECAPSNCLTCESDNCLPGSPEPDPREPPENVLDHTEVGLSGHDYPCEYPRHACVCEDSDADPDS